MVFGQPPQSGQTTGQPRQQRATAFADLDIAYAITTIDLGFVSTGGNTTTLYTPTSPGAVFVIYSLWMSNHDAVNPITVELRSNATDIARFNLPISAATYGTIKYDLHNNGIPILIGRVVGDPLVIEGISAAGSITGYLSVGERTLDTSI